MEIKYRKGSVVEYMGAKYLYLGESLNGVHAVIVSPDYSRRIEVAHSQLRPCPERAEGRAS